MIHGFRYHEMLRGTFHLLDAPTDERAIEVTLVVRAPPPRRISRSSTWELGGEIVVEGIAERAPLQGTLGVKLLDERRLSYRFTFAGDDGRTYEFWGQKDWSPIAPVESMTVLPASIYAEGGDEIARATLRFDLRNDLGAFLRSFRLP
jgi:hypothetical protein